MPLRRPLAILILLPVCWLAAAARAAEPRAIDFNRDIRPILSDNCFACHGPDKNARKAELRLDQKEGLFRTKEAVTVVVPAKLAQSELYRRISTDDPDDHMPPAKSTKKLTKQQIELIRQWIEQGAVWKGHWAFIVPTRPAVPPVADVSFAHNPIDHFILTKQLEKGLKHLPSADRATLIRRLSLDLTGLPPTPERVRAFVTDQSPNAYEKLVDELLASPHYGERMAVLWLDLVRYADTIGYHSDNPRNIYPYRDYVINSFNANLPFDRFTREQLAGDLLPESTTLQKVASAYNRLLQTTEEGGAQPKEYAAKYMSDRVRNISSTWLGATLGCAECHDHKFDPFTQRDFYSMQAFFADVQEAPTGRRENGMPMPDAMQASQLKQLDDQIVSLKKKLETTTPELAVAQEEWEKQIAARQTQQVKWTVLTVESVKATGGTKLTAEPDGTITADGTAPAKESYTVNAKVDSKGITGVRLEALADPKFPASGPGMSPNGNFVLTEFRASAVEAAEQPAKPQKLARTAADHSQEGFPIANAIDGKQDTGWAVLPEVGKPHEAIFELAKPIAETPVSLTIYLDFKSQYPQHQIGRFRLSVSSDANPAGSKSLPGNVRAILAIDAAKRSEAQKQELASYYRTIAPPMLAVREELATTEKQKAKLLETVPHVLVSASSTPRPIRMLPRGNWLDDSGEIVEPAVPGFLGKIDVKGRPTRLDLANWIVSRDNPLTARVFVNRLWRMYFGQGISKSMEDFGAQGEWPTHPELLDWLAVEFIESGWDVKHVVRLMVTSGTYRQSSKGDRTIREKDPENRVLARQQPLRLDAEFVRDNALAISGLLSDRLGGESVKPYQPAGYWDYLNFPTRTYVADTGEKQHRRGLYTHWQRTFLHPSLRAFDAPTREECEANRPRSNIPQQALVLLNDPTYVEAARALAERMVRNGGTSAEEKIAWGFDRAVARRPSLPETRVLRELYEKHAKEYAADVKAAVAAVKVGELTTVPADIPPVELAAWMSVSRAILNLHETITRN